MSDYPAAWQRYMRISLWLLGGLFIVAVLAVALLRLAYPYELEWMEGGTLLTVQRLAAGNQIYVPPSVDFVPFIYTPLYFYLGSGLVSLFGGGFTPLRLLSLAASLGSLTMIFLLVRNRTRDIFWSFIGAAFFAACFEIGGGWLDLARNDALYLFFLLLAVFLWERSRGGFVGHLLAGLAFVLAFLTKQSALLVLVPILAWILITERGSRRWILPGVTLGGILASVGLLTFLSHGWFNYYVFQLPASHELAKSLVVEFWRFDLLASLPFGLLALFWLLLPSGSEAERKDRRWLLILAVAFIGSSYFSRLHAGGWNNVLLPAYAMLAVILAVTLGRIFQAAERGNSGRTIQLMIYAVCFLQFAMLIFDPRDHLPTAADRQAGDELLTRLRATEGQVWAPHHGWLAVAAGGAASAHSMAIEDVLRGGDARVAEMLEREIQHDIESGRWSLILLDVPHYETEIQTRYRPAGSAFADSSVFWTVTGLRTRPELVYELKDD